MNLLLIRHGETDWNREGRYQGRTDVPLSAEGQRQVAALATRLATTPIALAVSSPLARARVTAEAIVSARGIPLGFDPRLVEISHGQWEGKLASEVEQTHPELLRQWKTEPDGDLAAGPDAESLGEVTARAWAALADVASRLRSDQTALVVAHDAVNRALLCRVLGLPLARVWSFRQAPATVNALTGPSLDQLQVVRLNDSEHCAPLFTEHQHRAL
jgi:probable phosphoglycerate mutase